MFAQVDNYLVIPVPFDVGDFYISGTGYLCARTPMNTVLSEEPVSRYGITAPSLIVGYASLEERLRAGLDLSNPQETALLVLKPRGYKNVHR